MSSCTPLSVPAKITWLLPALYVISMEDAKLHNLSVEPVFLFCELQSIRQSFASFVYKIKQIEAERHQIPTTVQTLKQKCWSKVFGVPSQLITAAQKGLLLISGWSPLKLLSVTQ